MRFFKKRDGHFGSRRLGVGIRSAGRQVKIAFRFSF